MPAGPRPRLIATAVPKDPEGVVIALHGGASRRGKMAVSPAQLSVLRMVPIAAAPPAPVAVGWRSSAC